MTMPDEYVWDIFLSYPRGKHHTLWVSAIFLDEFKHHLREALGREPAVFLDTDSIDPGDAWKARLKSALGRSRILLPIWSVKYFLSESCRSECAVMLYREQRLSFRNARNPSGLIVPVRLFDGDRYPQFAKDIQHHDHTSYNSTAEYFKKSARYMDFQTDIQSWAPSVAKVINSAPAWNSEWITKDWLDAPFDNAKNDQRLKANSQQLESPTLA